ncbi:uncharacterized protein N7446_005552 [Penicillium canescens]|uniref:Uncharacterized protein n=1 Tax=Penicillium canescens TaxID=5083 RepID=A0AAD6IJT3_PENCN|nr:uncharacterized protein N7446_005552 [Penicillium canescens]KAJ6050212.1 hypothetical protein N7444_006928 [Penicillium canescens]KAJ6050926.1 hypothetical protein N7460_001460 [Penicillium canescens]KAJ6061432.1 hypothetical protein N7446_005552 [Penicillium canescens]
MSSVLGVKEVDGRLVATARDIEPPAGWTNDFETLGGETVRGNDGEIYELLEYKGIDTTETKPLYAAMASGAGGERFAMMEAGSTTAFYLYHLDDDYLYRINQPDNLAEIVKRINEEDGGLGSIEFKKI